MFLYKMSKKICTVKNAKKYHNEKIKNQSNIKTYKENKGFAEEENTMVKDVQISH